MNQKLLWWDSVAAEWKASTEFGAYQRVEQYQLGQYLDDGYREISTRLAIALGLPA